MKNNRLIPFRSALIACLLMLFLYPDVLAQKKLTKLQAENAAQKEWNEEKKRLLPAAERAWGEGVITFEQYKMAIAYRIFGAKPTGGRSLYISLHGGGNAPVAVNNQQWENQRTLYNIKEGLVVVPRAPTNTWNLWHEDHIDNMLDSIITYAVISQDVNPDKVYILGYSAGGDGVFQLAPRMADRFAAASMMAGHPGDADMSNLRNLPFSIFMGGLDSAYNRNTLAARYNGKLDSLRAQDPGGYVHEFHLYPDKPHWMDKRDTIAIPWMANFVRNTLPKKVIWVQDNRLQHRFYWLSTSIQKTAPGEKAEVEIKGNQILVSRNDFSELELNLNDQLVDLDKPVTVIIGGRKVFDKKIERSLGIVKITVGQYRDPHMIFNVKLLVKANQVKEVN
ncbi:hypothetical protein [Pedobacter sp. Leaf250]|uniref:hypothetical protein n=1 Tax=Pedobacter sp. Leaf250 TaxID=2876559 RepID=UPI001E321234|nr:hypothetical protein [Pedobacter sp. Leaf250]